MFTLLSIVRPSGAVWKIKTDHWPVFVRPSWRWRPLRTTESRNDNNRNNDDTGACVYVWLRWHPPGLRTAVIDSERRDPVAVADVSVAENRVSQTGGGGNPYVLRPYACDETRCKNRNADCPEMGGGRSFVRRTETYGDAEPRKSSIHFGWGRAGR